MILPGRRRPLLSEERDDDCCCRSNRQHRPGGGQGTTEEAKAVTFGATDAPLKGPELDKFGLLQFPMVIGGILPVVNIEGIRAGELVLDGPTLAGIFVGTVVTWDDPAIKTLNPDVRLPSQPITVVHRSDSAGTTFNFTYYLGQVSAIWKSNVGSATSVEWPVGVGAKGKDGVSNTVGQIKGSIGCIEHTYALQTKMIYAKMVNRAGKVVAPTSVAFQAAAADADWNSVPGYGLILANQPGAESWPMTAASFILIPKRPDNPAALVEALKFFSWAYAKGDKIAEELDFVPIPKKVVTGIERVWAREIKDSNGRTLYSATAQTQ